MYINNIDIFINNFITVIYFNREKSKSRLNKIIEKKEIIMINTYFIPSMFVGNEYKDRYYPNLFDLANKKDNIFFNPINLHLCDIIIIFLIIL